MRYLSTILRRVLIITTFATLVVSSVSPFGSKAEVANQAAATDMERQARELWEKAIAAKGGREELRKVSSLYIVRIQPAGDREYNFYAFPDYWFDYGFGGHREDIAKTVHNGQKKVTWWLPPKGEPAIPRTSIDEDMSASMVAQFTYLMVTRWLEPTPFRVRKEWLGLKRVSVVEVDANGWRVDYYLDPTTYLPTKVLASDGEIQRAKGERGKVVEFKDYVTVAGIKLPQKVIQRWLSSPQKWQETVSYEINSSFDPHFFERPPNNRTTPESWRLKSEVKQP